MLYVKRIHQDWKKKWGLKLCGYLFWNKTIFNNLIILVVKPGWIVHAKYGFFFLWLTQRAYIMTHTNFLQTLLKLLCSIFLIVDINTYCFYQHFLMQPLYDPYQPVSFLFSFPCPVPFASQGCWFKICPVRSQRKYHVITRSNWPNQHFVSTFWMLKFRVLRHDYNLSFTPYLHPRNLWRASSQATQDLDIGPQVQIESSIPTT